MHQTTCTVGGRVIDRIDSVFKCPLCEKTFSNAEYFRKHYKTHLTETAPSIVSVESNGQANASEGATASADLFCSLSLNKMGLKFNLKYSLLICSACNVGLKKCENYLESHFTNKFHAKQNVFKKIKKLKTACKQFLKKQKIFEKVKTACKQFLKNI